ncbi:MAG: polyphosphate polymerase domain-containing protein [Chloroflexi bacterium]|nr:polyphosphate polymerase domain-containing protein [Chloroflexota bacterium]
MLSTPLQLVPETGELALARAIFPIVERTDDRVARMLGEFQPTSLGALSSISLLNRVDTKFLIAASDLPGMLAQLVQHYAILEIDGLRQHAYRTVYFDTADFALYRDHHDGRQVRHKVRSRTYLDSDLSFFEIKTRTDAGRTVKQRLQTVTPIDELTPTARALLAAHVPPHEQQLFPTLRNDFRRITLAGLHTAERLTIDLGIQFTGVGDGPTRGHAAMLPGIVVAELKQSGVDRGSPFAQVMQRRSIRPTRVSKYCVGIALLAPHAVEHAFAGQLRAIEALSGRPALVS